MGIIIFVGATRYVLAGIIITALSEAFWVLVFNGNLRRAPAAWRRAAHDGVATVDFLACCQWDDGIAGVPYLMLMIYGLPLASTPNPIGSAVSAFCMFTRTKGWQRSYLTWWIMTC